MPLYNRGSSFYTVCCLSKEESSKIGKNKSGSPCVAKTGDRLNDVVYKHVV